MYPFIYVLNGAANVIVRRLGGLVLKMDGPRIELVRVRPNASADPQADDSRF